MIRKKNMPRARITPEMGEAIKIAVAGGSSGLREFARNAGIPEGTVLSWAKRKGLTIQIATAKVSANSQLARQVAQPDAIGAITPLQSVATTMVQRGQRHVERMANVTEKVLPYLESMQPAAIIDGVHEIDKFNKMARLNYGLSESTNAGGSVSLSIVTGQAVIQVAQS